MSEEAIAKAIKEGKRVPKVGDVVVWHNSRGVPFNALVQCVWGPECVNLVVISGDENKKDQYGRQLEHQTSVTHRHEGSVHGFYWRWPDEEPIPYKEPLMS